MVTKKADLSMKSGPEVPEGAHRPLVADAPHFRDLGSGSLVLYLPGAHIPERHAELPDVAAEHVDGVWRPVTEERRK